MSQAASTGVVALGSTAERNPQDVWSDHDVALVVRDDPERPVNGVSWRPHSTGIVGYVRPSQTLLGHSLSAGLRLRTGCLPGQEGAQVCVGRAPTKGVERLLRSAVVKITARQPLQGISNL